MINVIFKINLTLVKTNSMYKYRSKIIKITKLIQYITK